MIFIENYKEAKDYHYQVLKCWFVHKLYPSSRRSSIHKCTLPDCESCKEQKKDGGFVKRQYYKKLSPSLRIFLQENLNNLIQDNSEAFKSEIVKNYRLLLRTHKELTEFIVESTYKDFFQKKCGRRFLNLLNVNTCLSCNINYTLEVVDSHARAQLDHFMPKTYFPVLGVNFYNLIPVCPRCNHLKGSGKNKHWWCYNYDKLYHPYFKENNVFKFNYQYTDSTNSFDITFSKADDVKATNTIAENRLAQIYSAHCDFELRDLYNLRKRYSKNHLNQMIKFLEKTGITKEETYEMLFGIKTNESEYHKRPFSKFKSDIIEELLKLED